MPHILDLRRGADLPPFPPPALDESVLVTVRRIIEDVRARGDQALAELTLRHDGADVTGGIRVPDEEVRAATIEPPLERALERMADRLRDLHGRQVPQGWTGERDGIRFGEVVRPLAAVGCYVPGGRAAYPSTALMTAIPARVAGVDRVAVATPPAADGSVAPAVLVAARVAGVDEVYRLGGAQAVAALALGTATVARVDKIVGPGNAWVTAAKRELAGVVGIDGLAGPTELVVVAGPGADPGVVAVDLVAQAEHDPQARAVLLCTDPALARDVERALASEAASSPRGDVVRAALAHAVLAVCDEDRAAGLVDRLAPEHLQVLMPDPEGFLGRVRSFGAAFLGPHTPVSFGDYGVGSNHVLPTMATARFASGLRAADMVTISSFVEASAEGSAAVGPEVELVASAEGLPGHARAAEVRR
jgi:histidinol dehydrogenase